MELSPSTKDVVSLTPLEAWALAEALRHRPEEEAGCAGDELIADTLNEALKTFFHAPEEKGFSLALRDLDASLIVMEALYWLLGKCADDVLLKQVAEDMIAGYPDAVILAEDKNKRAKDAQSMTEALLRGEEYSDSPFAPSNLAGEDDGLYSVRRYLFGLQLECALAELPQELVLQSTTKDALRFLGSEVIRDLMGVAESYADYCWDWVRSGAKAESDEPSAAAYLGAVHAMQACVALRTLIQETTLGDTQEGIKALACRYLNGGAGVPGHWEEAVRLAELFVQDGISRYELAAVVVRESEVDVASMNLSEVCQGLMRTLDCAEVLADVDVRGRASSVVYPEGLESPTAQTILDVIRKEFRYEDFAAQHAYQAGFCDALALLFAGVRRYAESSISTEG